jgi:hypothetical protein
LEDWHQLTLLVSLQQALDQLMHTLIGNYTYTMTSNLHGRPIILVDHSAPRTQSIAHRSSWVVATASLGILSLVKVLTASFSGTLGHAAKIL